MPVHKKDRTRYFTLFLSILVLSATDAAATIQGVTQGYMLEVNPLMQYILERDAFTFYWTKILITLSLGFTLFVLTPKYRLACIGMYIVAYIYVTITLWHTYILWSI